MEKQNFQSFLNCLNVSFIIKGNAKRLILLRKIIQEIEKAGGEKFQSLDSFLEIEFINGDKKQTLAGFLDIVFGDLSIEENKLDYMRYPDEITSIGFYVDCNSEDSEARPTYFPIATIKKIKVLY